jgi:hypothetical protein
VREALHLLGTVAVAPYALLAIAFLLIGQLASSKSLGALLWTLLTQFVWVIPWGALGFAAALLLIAGLGFSVHLRWVGYLALFLVSLASLLILVIVPGDAIDLGSLLFLAPCIAVLAASAWFTAAEWRG